MFLPEVGLPIDAKGLLVEAAARPMGPRVARPRSRARSFPIGVYCQVEHVASGPPSAHPGRAGARGARWRAGSAWGYVFSLYLRPRPAW